MKKEVKEPLVDEVVFTEKLLQLTYNKLAATRSVEKRNFHYDIYVTKKGVAAKLAFTKLAKRLVNRRINPALYLKVVCGYGKFKDASYMPAPNWLALRSTIKLFRWLQGKQRASYELESDWKASIDTWKPEDILYAVDASANMVRQVMKAQGYDLETATRVLWPELTGWFQALHALQHKANKEFWRCKRVLVSNKLLRDHAVKVYNEILGLKKIKKR